MTTRVGGILLDMAARTARLEKDMKDAKRHVKSAADDIRGSINTIKTAMGALAVALGANSFAGLIKGAVDAQDHLLDLSQITGVAVEKLGGLGYGAKLSGADLDKLATGAGRLSRNMSDMQRGTGEAREAFKTLKLDIEDGTGILRNTDDVILDLADRFSGMKDGTLKTALAMQLLGRSGAELIPFLNQGREAIQAQIEEWKTLTGVTEESANRASLFNDQMDKLGLVQQGVANTLAAGLLPIMSQFVDWLTESGRQTGFAEGAAKALDFTLRTLASSFQGIGFIVQKAILDIGALGKAFWAFVKGDWDTASAILEQRKKDEQKLTEDFVKTIEGIWTRKEMVVTASAKRETDNTKQFSEARQTALQKEKEKIVDLLNSLRGIDKSFGEGLALLEKAYRQGLIPTTEEYVKLVEELIFTKTELGKESRKLAEEGLKRLEEAEKERLKTLQDAVDADKKELEALKKQNEQYGKTRVEIARMSAAKLEATLATKDFTNSTWEEIDALEKRLQIAKDIITQEEDLARKERVSDLEQVRRDEAKETAKIIEQSLTDALMRGFEEGKDIAENFKDTLKNIFKTLVLKPIIQFIVAPISNTIGQILGGSGTGFGTPGFGGGGSIFGGGGGGMFDLFSGNTLFTNAIFQKLGVMTGSQFIADIGNLGLGTPLFAVAGNLLAGNPRGAALSGIGGAIGSIWGPAGAAVGTFAGQLLDSVLGGKNKSPAIGIGVQGTGTVGYGDLSGINFQGRSANASQQFAWPLPASMVWDSYGIRDQATQMLKDTFEPWIKAFDELGLNSDLVRNFRANVDFMQPGAMPWDLTAEGYIKAFSEALQQVTAQLQEEFGPALRLAQAELQLEGQLTSMVRQLPQALGITTLEQYKNSLAVSEYVSPGARFSAAHAQFSDALARYRQGDLSAIQEIPGTAQALLAAGREMYASGPQFGQLFRDVNTILNDVLRAQREIEKDLLKDIDISILESSKDQVAELRAGFKAVVDELAAVRVELRKLRAA